jgi:periplasmic glucans biosynthesis protein
LAAKYFMTQHRLDRRSALQQALGFSAIIGFARGLAAVPAWAQDAAVPPAPAEPAFSIETVKAEAKTLSEAAFAKPEMKLPEPFNKLSYDQYRDIRFRTEQAFWKGDKLDFEVQPFAMGWLYDMPVQLSLVTEGKAQALLADASLFAIGPLIGNGPTEAPFGFSGFRIHSPINRADYFDEYVVFQGASYLRAVGRDEQYGASARGLALNTAQPNGEEFPFFRAFWIEKPAPGATQIIVHALLDSPSTTGAYRFAIGAGDATVMDVDLWLYPRQALAHVGLGPLTSMFLHAPADQRKDSDFRPAVHDSEGLAMWNGSGERLWRQLVNPATLQVSAFMDKDPRGFGLWQRDRAFSSYEDLEARYERRPSVWIEPRGGWGEGFVELVEIPVNDEIHDNIVVYWRPAQPLAAGVTHAYSYRLTWSEHVPAAWTAARVAKTRVGPWKKPETFLFVIDLIGTVVEDPRDLPVADVAASAGALANVVVQRNREIKGVRVSFELSPNDADVCELSMVLKAQDQVISEKWLYRWTKP